MADAQGLKMERLQKAVQTSLQTLLPFRRTRRDMLREYVGHKYGKMGATNPVYLNLLNMTASAYLMALSANDPRVLVTCESEQLKPFAYKYQQGVNRLVKRIDLKGSIDRAILDAFFGLGIVKVCLADGFEVEIEGETYDMGYPAAKPVSLEDWVHDTAAQEWPDISFCGHRFRAPIDLVKDDSRFDKKATRDLQPTSKYPRGRDGESSNMMFDGCDKDELEEQTDLWEIWIPRTNRIITVAQDGDGIGTTKLSDEEWKGPEDGPYHFLTFDDVPDNTMPIPPAYQLYELHKLVNGLLRKQARQARRQKDIGMFKGSAADMVDRINSTPDGEWFKSEDPDGIKMYKMGGVDQGNFAFTGNIREMFNMAAGNLQALLGLGPMSNTAGQDRMINENVGQKVAKMQAKVTAFTGGIVRDIGWLMWDHEGLIIPGRENLPGGQSHDVSWKPGSRRGQFIDYMFQIEPYSQAYQSPSEKSQKLISYVQGVILPAMPMIQQQGGGIDWQKLNRTVSEYDNMPEIADIITWAQPLTDRDQAMGPGPSHQQMKPPVTQRTVTRVNGGQRQGPPPMPQMPANQLQPQMAGAGA